MRVFRRRAFGLAIPLLTLFSLPAHPQNLLINPGFDRDLEGWDVRTEFYPPGYVGASAQWDATDFLGGNSGSVRFHLSGGRQSVNRVQLTQCLAATPGRRYTGGGVLRTDDQLQDGVFVSVEMFSSAGCGGDPVASSGGGSLPWSGFTHTNSAGAWLPVSASVPAGVNVQSVRFGVGIYSSPGSYYSHSAFDGLFDDAYLVEDADPAATWILPAAGRGAGAAGSLWTTALALANPGLADALVTLKFLFHDADGRSGPEKTVYVRAGGLLEYPDVIGTLFARTQDYGAIRITSSSASLVVQSETSTPSMGGTVGQALPAFGPADYATTTPKTLAPIRENESFRTNLVLANATEIPVTAHVALFAADGTTIGSRDVDLPPLGMTQINRVASALGAASLDAGRISVSTPTPGGLVAAYASVIDNVTNDPRTLLPQDAAAALNRPNLLTNPRFDRDLSGWTLTLNGPDGHRSGAWDLKDAAGDIRSGSAYLAAGYDPGTTIAISALLRQCASVVSGLTYGLQAKAAWSSGGIFLARPLPRLRFSFHASSDCTGGSLGGSDDILYQVASPTPFEWLAVPTRTAVAPTSARSASVELSASAAPFGGVSVYFDDVIFSEGPSIWTPVVPATASIGGLGGSHWTTTLTLANPAPDLATSYLYGPAQNLPAGTVLSIPDVVRSIFGLSETWFPLRPLTTSPAVAITAETWTPVPGGGTVGQALTAFHTSDFAGATPKTIAPVRDDGAFRTNLVLVNVTGAPLVVRVELFDPAGSSIDSRDVPLDAGAATQIGAVGRALSGDSVDTGRLAVSTATPGGLVAAYASVIDNVTNDPRTLLPR